MGRINPVKPRKTDIGIGIGLSTLESFFRLIFPEEGNIVDMTCGLGEVAPL